MSYMSTIYVKFRYESLSFECISDYIIDGSPLVSILNECNALSRFMVITFCEGRLVVNHCDSLVKKQS